MKTDKSDSIRNITRRFASTFRAGLTAIFISGLFFTSCLNEEVCEDIATLPVRLGFYRTDTIAATPPRMSVDSLTIFGLGNDSILYNNLNSVGQIELPLNSLSDTTSFILRWHTPGRTGLLTDTLTFVYRREPNLISMDCGFVTFFNLQNVYYTGTLINVINIDNSNIRTSLDEHIKIFPVFLPAAGR
jgi:hypothetical protein